MRRIAASLGLGRHRVRRIMREEGLQAIAPKRFVPRTTDSKHQARVSPNLLTGVLPEPLEAGLTVVGDITYLPLRGGGGCYLATFQDKVTRRVIGWDLGAEMTATLVVNALQRALRQGCIRRGALVHTDQGAQYVSERYRNLLAAHGLQQSMSAQGNCYDNAQAESFFARFKVELVEDGVAGDGGASAE